MVFDFEMRKRDLTKVTFNFVELVQVMWCFSRTISGKFRTFWTKKWTYIMYGTLRKLNRNSYFSLKKVTKSALCPWHFGTVLTWLSSRLTIRLSFWLSFRLSFCPSCPRRTIKQKVLKPWGTKTVKIRSIYMTYNIWVICNIKLM